MKKIEAIGNNDEDLIGAIAASYESTPDTCRIGVWGLPGRDDVIEVIHLLRELLFPGFFGRRSILTGDISRHVGSLIGEIRSRLRVQIRSALRHRSSAGSERDGGFGKRADAVASAFLGTLPKVRSTLAT
ncbi:MAG TPA: hypothetical protein VHC46_01265, partial [Thermodesulfobacteriota bacterium]|nr:hypothetical protein [Thermodesulfobacteriota bacterium]